MTHSRSDRRHSFLKHRNRKLERSLRGRSNLTVEGDEIVAYYPPHRYRRQTEYRVPLYKHLADHAPCRCDYCIKPYSRKGRRSGIEYDPD